jgi:hypothetical protein
MRTRERAIEENDADMIKHWTREDADDTRVMYIW